MNMYELKKRIEEATKGLSEKQMKLINIMIGDDNEISGIHRANVASYIEIADTYNEEIFTDDIIDIMFVIG